MGAHLQYEILAAGSLAPAVAVAIGHPHLIQQRHRPLRIVVGVGARPLWVVERSPGIHGVLLRRRHAQEHELVDLVAVHRQRHRLPEPLVQEDRALHRVRVVQVEPERDAGVLGILPLQHAVVADLLVLLVQREAARIGEAPADVHLALHHAQDRHLLVGEERRLHAVDVGQLIAGAVHREEVGVAGKEDGGRVAPLLDPRRQFRARVPQGGRTGHARQQAGDPVVVAVLLGELLGVGVELGMELPHVVRRCEKPARLHFGPVQQQCQTVERDRSRKRDHQRVVTVRLPTGELTPHREPAAAPGGNIEVRQNVVIHPHEVRGGERLAVRPLHPLAQMDGEHGLVVGDLVPLGAVRDGFVERGVGPEQEGLASAVHVAPVGRPGARGPQLAAVAAGLFVRLQHQRIVRQPLD